MFDLTDLLFFFIFSGFIMLWWNAQGIKQRALQATRKHCKQMDLQLLDDGLVLRGFWIKRSSAGKLRLWRSYDFEFTSTGNERYRGQITLFGVQVESIELQPYRLN